MNLNSDNSKIKKELDKIKNDFNSSSNEMVEMYKVIKNINNNIDNKTFIKREIELKLRPDKLPILYSNI